MTTKLRLMMRSLKIKWICLIIINAVFVVLTIMRSFFCIAVLDEAFNVGQALRTIQGNVFLVENWDYFQTGDSFLIPFLYVFYKVTGSTEGIILFSRVVFIILQFLFSIFIFKVLSRFFDRVSSFFAVLVFITAVEFILFYMWYDTWEVLFRLFGLFLIYFVFCSFEKINHKQAYVLVFFAGIAHACMVYAYPTMIFVYICVLVLLFTYKRKQSARVHSLFLLFYVLGSILVFVVFMIYAFRVGISNLFVFNKVMAEAGLASTGRDGFFSISSMLSKTQAFFIENIQCYGFALVVFFIDVILLYILRKHKNRTIIFCVIMIYGCFVQLMSTLVISDCINMFMSYISFYVVPLYFLLRKNSDRREHYKDLIMIVLVPSVVAGLSYNYTALFGAFKFACGMRPCAIITVLMLFEVIMQTEIRLDKRFVAGVFATLIVAMNILTMYVVSFEGTKPYDCKTLIRSGIYKGIVDVPENAKRYETVEKDLADVITEGDKTIGCGPYAMEFYLMSDLKPDAANLWDPNNTDLLFAYYEMYYGEPDIIVLHDSADDVTSPEFLEFVDRNYYLAKYTDGFFIYHHN